MCIEVFEIGATLLLDPAALAAATTASRIIVADDYLRPEVAPLCAGSMPSLLVRVAGGECWIGPLLQTDESICYDCLCFYLALRRWRPASSR